MPRRSLLWLAAALVSLCGFGCSSQYSAEPPAYLAEAIRERPPGEGLTLYPTNGPWGGVAVNDFAQVGSTVFAATEAGLYRSEDEGQTWQLSSPEEQQRKEVRAIATIGRSLFAGVSGQLYRDDDSGESWKDITPERFTGALSSLVAVRDELWASGTGGPWFSKDKGESWQSVQALVGGIGSGSIGRTPIGGGAAPRIRGLFAVGHTLFAGAAESNMLWRIEGWPPRYTPIRFGDGQGIDIVGMASLGGEPLAATPEGLYQPAASEVWRLAKKPPEDRKITTLSVTDEVVFVGTDDGIYRTEDLGSNWEFVGVRGEQIRALSPAGAGLFAGTNAAIYRSGIEGKDWVESGAASGSIRKLVSGDGGRFALTENRVLESFDLGTSWQVAKTAELLERFRSISADGARLLITSNLGLYLRDTPASSWSDISLDRIEDPIRAVGLKGDVLLAGASNILRSQDGGISWQLAKTPELVSWPTAFEAAPDGRWLAVYSPLLPGGVVESDDQGQTWKDLNSDQLVNRDVRALRLVGDAVFVGTEQGTISSLDLSSPDATWSLQVADPSRGDISALWVDPNTLNDHGAEVLVAGTTNGLYWTNDGGTTFQRADTNDLPSRFDGVSSIDYTDGHLMVATDAGVYYAIDRIPRPWPPDTWMSLVLALVALAATLQLIAALLVRGAFAGADRLSDVPLWAYWLVPFALGARGVARRERELLRGGLEEDLVRSLNTSLKEVEPQDLREVLSSQLTDLPKKTASELVDLMYHRGASKDSGKMLRKGEARLKTAVSTSLKEHAKRRTEEKRMRHDIVDDRRRRKDERKALLEERRRANEARRRMAKDLRQRQLEAEVKLARQNMGSVLQLPEGSFERPGVRLAHRLKQSTSISGDFYNIIPRGDGSVGIYLVDVEGHGLVASQTAQDVHRVLTDPSLNWGTGEAREQLEIADRVIYERLGDRGIAVTMNFTEIDPGNKVLRFANAGMPAPLLFHPQEAEPEPVRAAGIYVGAGYARRPVKPERAELPLRDGDILLIFSDGITEAKDDQGAIFGERGIVAAFAAASTDSPEKIADAILAAVAKHEGTEEPADDQTLIVVRVGEPLAEPTKTRPDPIEIGRLTDGSFKVSLLNTWDVYAAAEERLKPEFKSWMQRQIDDSVVAGNVARAVWVVAWESAVLNALWHGSVAGDEIHVEFRGVPGGGIEIELSQPKLWRNWDEYLGDRRRRIVETEKIPPTQGTSIMLKWTDAIRISNQGRQITMSFNPQAVAEKMKEDGIWLTSL